MVEEAQTGYSTSQVSEPLSEFGIKTPLAKVTQQLSTALLAAPVPERQPLSNVSLSNVDRRSVMAYVNMMASAPVAPTFNLYFGSFVGTHIETHNVDNWTQNNDNSKTENSMRMMPTDGGCNAGQAS